MGQARPQDGAGEYHIPVLLTEVVEIFRPVAPGVVVDATFGGGGHSRALLEALPGIQILGIDRDPDAAAPAEAGTRLRFTAGNFRDLERIAGEDLELRRDDVGGAVGLAGVLFDLGVSSHQLDTPSRGFSYHRAGPLDMRMDPGTGPTAGDVVNEWPERDIAGILRRFGEERHARRIAAAIVAARPIADTAALAEVVAGAVPAAARRRGHPARRTFQAIRIAVNAELDALAEGLDAALHLVRPGGRVAVISYHSLEDRIVKRRFSVGTAGCECPPGLPVCACGKTAELRSLTRGGVTPSIEEIERNPRARSARLRAVERIAA